MSFSGRNKETTKEPGKWWLFGLRPHLIQRHGMVPDYSFSYAVCLIITMEPEGFYVLIDEGTMESYCKMEWK
jgi:hypothetical protein